MSDEIVVPPSKASARRAARNADQVEVNAIRDGVAPVAECLADDAIAYDRLPEEYDTATNPEGNPEWAEESDAKETGVGEAINELERRIAYSSNFYPFELSDAELKYLPDLALSGVYEFCLALSTTNQLLTTKPACLAVREFERLVGRLLKCLLHPAPHRPTDECAWWYRSGAPPEADRPVTMSEMLADLHDKTNEWDFFPPTGQDAQAEEGDDGIDVVVWKRFGAADSRIGKPFLLAQCACGTDQYGIGKRHELSPVGFEKKWRGIISYAGVLRCLATPRHIPHAGDWREATSDGGIVLDRIRLNWIAEACLHASEKAEFKAGLDPHTQALKKPRPKITLSGSP